MKSKPIRLRTSAVRDVNEALDHYFREAGAEAARGWINALEEAYDFLTKHPGAGSPRFAGELDLPGLRHWRLNRFPYLVFYMERARHIDVWRVLHAHRDIPAWMRDPQDR